MTIPDLERKRVMSALDAFCERVPVHVRDKLSYHYEIRGNSVTLTERRPLIMLPKEFSNQPVAKFRYNPNNGRWTLRWADRNGRWHDYEGYVSVARIETLVEEVKRDPTGIFLG
jgi:hypothetical protein